MRAEDWIGQTLSETYRIEQLLGMGGMGAVYQVRNLRTDGLWAAKILRNDAEAEVFQRFYTEALAIAKLRHRHIVQVVDYQVDPTHHVPFLIMELLEGEDLQSRLRRRGQMSYKEAKKLIAEVGSALQAAHDHEVVHRDVKPQNLFIHRHDSASGDGEIYKVVDFGVSKIRSRSLQTPTPLLLGTPHYMAPESALGQSSELDGRADQFSLAVVLYRALSGTAPFEGPESVGVLYQVIHHEPEPLSRLVPELPTHAALAVERALRKPKSERFDSIREFVSAFVGASTDADQVTRLEPLPPLRDRQRPVDYASMPTNILLAARSQGPAEPTEPSRITPSSLDDGKGQAAPVPSRPAASRRLRFRVGVLLPLGVLALVLIAVQSPPQRPVRSARQQTTAPTPVAAPTTPSAATVPPPPAASLARSQEQEDAARGERKDSVSDSPNGHGGSAVERKTPTASAAETSIPIKIAASRPKKRLAAEPVCRIPQLGDILAHDLPLNSQDLAKRLQAKLREQGDRVCPGEKIRIVWLKNPGCWRATGELPLRIPSDDIKHLEGILDSWTQAQGGRQPSFGELLIRGSVRETQGAGAPVHVLPKGESLP